MFTADIAFKINIGYLSVKKSLIILDRRKIIKKYVKEAFLWDLIGVFASSTMMDWMGIKPAHFLVCLKYFSIKHYFEFLNSKLMLKEKFGYFFKLMKLLFFLLMISHSIACFWHYISFHNQKYNTWIKQIGIQEEDAITRYVYSFYWSVVTMMTIGYGDITPQNPIEVLIAIFAIIFGGVALALLISTFQEIMKSISQDKKELTYFFSFFAFLFFGVFLFSFYFFGFF